MATSQEVQQRVSYARTLLESGVNVQTACTMLQAKFPVSRSTAYKDVGSANAEIAKSDDGPAEEDPTIDMDSLQAQALHMFNVSVAQGNVKDACQAIKALDTILGWNGRKATLQGSASNGYV
jgi:hypothetical protein